MPRVTWVFLMLALAGVGGGAALWLARANEAAHLVWTAATVVAFLPLVVRVGTSLLRREPGDRPQAAVYLFTIRDPIPDLPIPLQPGDAEPLVALNRLVHDVYDRAGYDLTLDYQQPPPPPQMRAQDVQWMQQLWRS